LASISDFQLENYRRRKSSESGSATPQPVPGNV
jgi:hypothetical protein